MRKAIVNCWRGSELIATYEFGLPDAIVPGEPVSDESLRNQAKTELTNDGLATPPYGDIRFEVRRSN